MQLCKYGDCVNLHDIYFRIKFFKKYYPISQTDEFINCIYDLLQNEHICLTKQFIQHGNTTCYQHQLSVAYYTYKMCSFLKLNAEEAARGAMLHDFFLYDWHTLKDKDRRMHAFNHPKIALENAREVFNLTSMQEDIIVNHMWPITIKLPKYKETFIVTIADKLCCIMETFNSIMEKNKDY